MYARGNKKYSIVFTDKPPDIHGLWNGTGWEYAKILRLSSFRRESSEHHPPTECKLLYDRHNIYGIFRVRDKYVRCIHTGFQSPVYKDSCVEFFLQPKEAAGYFNFEFNCGGAMLASYVTDPTRTAGTVKGYAPFTAEDNLRIKRYSDMPSIIEPEISKDTVWHLGFCIPFGILEKYSGKTSPAGGDTWRANFYKCGNDTSHPHWGSWAPLSTLNFHLPDDFGEIQFAHPVTSRTETGK